MRQFKLDERLKICADFISYGSRIADVGTDHAYLPIWLALNGQIKFSFASDINDYPLENAKKNIKRYHVEDKVKLVKSDGLEMINADDIDEIVIAGMGGELISGIISKSSWVKKEKKRLILQPASSESDLREYLFCNGFKILKEKAVFSLGRVYTVINAVYTDEIQNWTLEQKYIGKLHENLNGAGIEYIKKQIRNLKNISKGYLARKDFESYFKNENIINNIEKIILKFGEKGIGSKS